MEDFCPTLIQKLTRFTYQELCFESLLELASTHENDEIQQKSIEVLELYYGIKEGCIESVHYQDVNKFVI